MPQLRGNSMMQPCPVAPPKAAYTALLEGLAAGTPLGGRLQGSDSEKALQVWRFLVDDNRYDVDTADSNLLLQALAHASNGSDAKSAHAVWNWMGVDEHECPPDVETLHWVLMCCAHAQEACLSIAGSVWREFQAREGCEPDCRAYLSMMMVYANRFSTNEYRTVQDPDMDTIWELETSMRRANVPLPASDEIQHVIRQWLVEEHGHGHAQMADGDGTPKIGLDEALRLLGCNPVRQVYHVILSACERARLGWKCASDVAGARRAVKQMRDRNVKLDATTYRMLVSAHYHAFGSAQRGGSSDSANAWSAWERATRSGHASVAVYSALLKVCSQSNSKHDAARAVDMWSQFATFESVRTTPSLFRNFVDCCTAAGNVAGGMDANEYGWEQWVRFRETLLTSRCRGTHGAENVFAAVKLCAGPTDDRTGINVKRAVEVWEAFNKAGCTTNNDVIRTMMRVFRQSTAVGLKPVFDEAWAMWQRMVECGHLARNVPDMTAYDAALRVCCKSARADNALWADVTVADVFEHMRSNGIRPNVAACEVLLRCGVHATAPGKMASFLPLAWQQYNFIARLFPVNRDGDALHAILVALSRSRSVPTAVRWDYAQRAVEIATKAFHCVSPETSARFEQLHSRLRGDKQALPGYEQAVDELHRASCVASHEILKSCVIGVLHVSGGRVKASLWERDFHFHSGLTWGIAAAKAGLKHPFIEDAVDRWHTMLALDYATRDGGRNPVQWLVLQQTPDATREVHDLFCVRNGKGPAGAAASTGAGPGAGAWLCASCMAATGRGAGQLGATPHDLHQYPPLDTKDAAGAGLDAIAGMPMIISPAQARDEVLSWAPHDLARETPGGRAPLRPRSHDVPPCKSRYPLDEAEHYFFAQQQHALTEAFLSAGNQYNQLQSMLWYEDPANNARVVHSRAHRVCLELAMPWELHESFQSVALVRAAEGALYLGIAATPRRSDDDAGEVPSQRLHVELGNSCDGTELVKDSMCTVVSLGTLVTTFRIIEAAWTLQQHRADKSWLSGAITGRALQIDAGLAATAGAPVTGTARTPARVSPAGATAAACGSLGHASAGVATTSTSPASAGTIVAPVASAISSGACAPVAACTNDLNAEQAYFVSEMMKAVQQGVCDRWSAAPFLLQGPPGTGKTTTVAALIAEAVQANVGQIVACAASNVAVQSLARRCLDLALPGKRLILHAREHRLKHIAQAVGESGLERTPTGSLLDVCSTYIARRMAALLQRINCARQRLTERPWYERVMAPDDVKGHVLLEERHDTSHADTNDLSLDEAVREAKDLWLARFVSKQERRHILADATAAPGPVESVTVALHGLRKLVKQFRTAVERLASATRPCSAPHLVFARSPKGLDKLVKEAEDQESARDSARVVRSLAGFDSQAQHLHKFDAATERLREGLTALTNYERGSARKRSGDAACFEQLLVERAHCVFTTLGSAGTSTVLQCCRSPALLVVDEAGQATEAETLIASRLSPVVCLLAGDVQQLPPCSSSENVTRSNFEWSMMVRSVVMRCWCAHQSGWWP